MVQLGCYVSKVPQLDLRSACFSSSCLDSKKKIKHLRWTFEIQRVKNAWQVGKVPKIYHCLHTVLGIAPLDSGSSLLTRQSELFVKQSHESNVVNLKLKEVLPETKTTSGWLREHPRALAPCMADGGRGEECIFSFQPVGSLVRTKAALSPDGVIPQRPRVRAVRLQEWVYSLYQLPPAQASLTHKLVTSLEWTAGEHMVRSPRE